MTESVEQPNMTWEVLQSQVEVFSEKLTDALVELGILEECKNLSIDHICVRLNDGSQVNDLKLQLSDAGEVISSVTVNGREISMIQLEQPLDLRFWKTSGVEIPYPKPSQNYPDGWEHVEFVLSGAENTLAGVQEAFSEKFGLDKRQLREDYSYSEDEPQAESDQMPNPTIGLKVKGVGLKFHANPIQVVVGYEQLD